MSGLGDVCAVACAEAFRGDGAIVASPMGPIPRLGARLAQASFEPDLVITDGVATITDAEGQTQGWMPFRRIFDVVWSGKRHVMMGASQLDQHGQQNLSVLGDHAQPKVQLLGSRGAPGNTIRHPTSYFVAPHTSRVFVPAVDFVSGLGPISGAHEIRRILTDLGVFDLGGPGQTMRVVSLHPGVSLDTVQERTGFEVHVDGEPPTTRGPTAEESALLDRLDPERRIRSGVER